MRRKKKKSEFPILSASVGPAEALNVFEDEKRNVRMLRNAVCLFFFFFSVLTSIASAQHGKKK